MRRELTRPRYFENVAMTRDSAALRTSYIGRVNRRSLARRRGKNMSEPQEYMFKYSDEEVRRLVVQSVFWSDLTEDLLRKAGLSAGMHVLDVGSGVGDVAMIAARFVGETGSVRGIDRSPDSLAVARKRAASAGFTNVVFEQAEIDNFETVDRLKPTRSTSQPCSTGWRRTRSA
jgi:SAM-dependent methyltransferase